MNQAWDASQVQQGVYNRTLHYTLSNTGTVKQEQIKGHVLVTR